MVVRLHASHYKRNKTTVMKGGLERDWVKNFLSFRNGLYLSKVKRLIPRKIVTQLAQKVYVRSAHINHLQEAIKE